MEMSCPYLDNCARKDFKKTEKYQPVRWELTKQYSDYKIVQLNVIMDVLGGRCNELDIEMSKIFTNVQRWPQDPYFPFSSLVLHFSEVLKCGKV